jgi:hypothetical protein
MNRPAATEARAGTFRVGLVEAAGAVGDLAGDLGGVLIGFRPALRPSGAGDPVVAGTAGAALGNRLVRRRQATVDSA